MRKLNIIILLFFLLFPFAVRATVDNVDIDIIELSAPANPPNYETGETIDITISGTETHSGFLAAGVWAGGEVDYGNGDSDREPGNDISGTFTYGFSYSYSNPGTYQITARVCANDMPVIGVWDISPHNVCATKTVTITVVGPSTCDGICPPGLDVSQDPDCGCLDDNGCCGIGCDETNDNDCAAGSSGGTSRYRNPLVWNEIIAFIWGIIMYVFGHAIVLAVLFILIGAYVIASSGGNISRVQLGKRIIIWTIIGYVVMVLARGIIMFIINFMGS